MAMTPEKRISYLRSEHQRIEYPVACCRKDHQNWPCDVIAGIDAAAAAERERSDALIAQAQDYARAESDRADRLAALALKALNQCHALERDDGAAYLDEWSMALDQLEGAAGEMSAPDSDPLEDAYQTGIKAERERIRKMALTEAAAGAKTGLDRIALRALAYRLSLDSNGDHDE